MKTDEDIVHFFESEEIFEKADNVFRAKKAELEGILPKTDIQHVGSCSVPGAVGKFDIDIQIRTDRESFKSIVETLKKHYQEKHPELWTDEFVSFCDNREYMIDIIVTVAGSRYDDFWRVRDRLMSDPQLLEEYNTLKRQFQGKTYGEYRKAKKAFLGLNGNTRFLSYQ